MREGKCRKRYFQRERHSEMRRQRATRYSAMAWLFATPGGRARKLYRPCRTSRPFCGALIDLRLENRHRAGRPAAQSGPGFAVATNRISFITSVFCFPPDNRHSIFAVSLLRLVSSPSSLPSRGPALTGRSLTAARRRAVGNFARSA